MIKSGSNIREVHMKETEERIKKEVVEALFRDDRMNVSDIVVAVSGGTVALDGTVPSETAPKAAETACFSVPGVTMVENNLTPVTPEEARPTDQELEVTIKDTLLWDSDVDPSDIKVAAVHGVITLEGSVNSYWKKLKAEALAADVDGVVRVINDLVIVPIERVVDRAIADDIAGALDTNTSVNPDSIDVFVQNGKVTLTGTVSDQTAYETVAKIVQYVPGVVDIQNDLIIA